MIRSLRVTVDGHEYTVTVEDLTDADNQLYPHPGSMAPPALPAAGPTPASASPASPSRPSPTPGQATAGPADGAVVAPMSGVVVEVNVSAGQQVTPGQTVAVLEAMKMKTPIVVETAGTVESVTVSVGDGVQVGQQILTLSQARP